ncbi:MAG: hypothetical protein ACRDKY_11715 [Solirubrobacteraceae bacterium]
MSGDGSSKHSLGTRIAATVGVLASLVGIATGVKALVDDDGPAKEPDAEVQARHVSDCLREHDLGQATQKRAPLPDETRITRAATRAETTYFKQTTYATCEWPAPPGGDPDGYRAITATTVTGPGTGEASGSTYADRIESRCDVLAVDYLHASMGEFQHLRPIRGRPAQTLFLTTIPDEATGELVSGAKTWTRSPLDGPLPFYPSRSELVVLHNDKNVLDDVRCVS